MRVKTGRAWVDHGPGATNQGLTGHHSALHVALEAPSQTATAKGLTCGICSEPTAGGRSFCSPAHARMGYGDRR